MTISARSSGILSRLNALITFQRFSHTLVAEELQARIRSGRVVDTSKWRKVNSKRLGIDRKMIPGSPWLVMRVLRNQGFEAYFVGGCVRDLILNRIPKDYDVITTATLKQIRNQFRHSRIVGRRFPICMVHVNGSVVEVSSFETVAEHAEGKEKVNLIEPPSTCGEKDLIRWRNSLKRDFTINSLFFDPFANKIYDYANGMKDLKSLKLRTLIPAQLSFKEDCVRILRGIRIAARLGFKLSKDTEAAICTSSSSIMSLDKSRMGMELNYMLSYGAAEHSLYLLQRFNLLELLLPCHAAYLTQQFKTQTAKSSVMLMKLFSSLDKLLTCDKPSDCSLWIGLLAFHLALVNNPQDALVVWTFSSVLYHGKWKEGVNYAREQAQAHVCYVPEVLDACLSKSDEELAREVKQLASLVQDSVHVLTETESLSKSMSRYPFSPCSDLVFISRRMGEDVAGLFHVLANDIKSYDERRKSRDINYHLLREGVPSETRYVLGQIISDTLRNGVAQGTTGIAGNWKSPQKRKGVSLGRTSVAENQKSLQMRKGVAQGRTILTENQKSQQKTAENGSDFDQPNLGSKLIQLKKQSKALRKQVRISNGPEAAGEKDLRVIGAQEREVGDQKHQKMVGGNELDAKNRHTERSVGGNDASGKRDKKQKKKVAEKRKWCTEQDAVAELKMVLEDCYSPQEKKTSSKVEGKGKQCIQRDSVTGSKKADLPREQEIYQEDKSEEKRGSPSARVAIRKNEKQKTDTVSVSVRPRLSSLFR